MQVIFSKKITEEKDSNLHLFKANEADALPTKLQAMKLACRDSNPGSSE